MSESVLSFYDDEVFSADGNAEASSSRRTPSRMGTPNRTGKRNAQTAELPDSSPAHPLRRSLVRSQITTTSLQTKVIALEQKLKARDEQLEARRVEVEKLMQDRRNLSRGYETASKARDDAKRESEAEKMKHGSALESQIRKTQQSEESAIALRSELSLLSRTHASHVSQSQSQVDLLNTQLAQVEQERDSLLNMRRQAHELSEALESKERELDDVRVLLTQARERNPLPSSAATDEDSLRKELKRQASLLSSLGKTNATLQAENTELRLRRDNVEMVKSEMLGVVKRAKAAEDRLSVCQEALDRARKDMDMLTINVASDHTSDDLTTTSASEYISLQHRLSQLASAHALCATTIAAKQSTVLDYSNRLEQISRESAASLDGLQKRAEVAERELRWAEDARSRAEKRLGLAREELEMLRTKSRTSEISNITGADDAAKVAELERQIELYRRAIDEYQGDNRDSQAKAILELDLVKRSDLNAALEKSKALQEEAEMLSTTLKQHEEAYEELRKEAEDMENRLGSGEYNTKVWRAVTFAGSPAAKDFAIRKETLEKLKKENEALVGQVVELQKSTASGVVGDSDKTVPIEVYQRLKEEQEAEQALHEKRLLRLREAFAARSKEFLESVQSLLGWRVRFGENGSDVRLESMYAAKSGKMGLRIAFKSEGGHFGTMKMMGGMAKTLEHAKEYWVLQRQSIPGFLAQVTLEAFEKTTIGRLAGYAGNEDMEEEE